MQKFVYIAVVINATMQVSRAGKTEGHVFIQEYSKKCDLVISTEMWTGPAIKYGFYK